MFTFGDIRNIAVQIEKNGEASYRKAAEAAKNRQVKETLLWMAEEEQKHAKWFASLTSTRVLSEEQQEMEAVGKMLLQDMVKGNDFLLENKNLENLETVKEVLKVSRTFEEETVLFYEFLLGFMDDEDDKAQLQRIIDEEQNHADHLEEMITALEDPCTDACVS